MRLLLDTHVFLRAVTANRRLQSSTREFLSRAEAVYVSAASIWEIAADSVLAVYGGGIELLQNPPGPRRASQ